MRRLSCLLWFGALLLAGCQSAAQPTPFTGPTRTAAAVPTLELTLLAATTETATSTPSPPPTETATVPPTATATASPIPVVRLGLPAWLEARADRIARDLLKVGTAAQIAVQYITDPAAALAAGEVEMALVAAAEGGIPAGQRPLVVTAPFVFPLQGLTQVGLEQILAGADPRLTILPWDELEPTRKALRIDGLLPLDPGYPLFERYTLRAHSGVSKDAEILAQSAQAIFFSDEAAQLAFTGDIMLDRALGYAIEIQDDLDYPFQFVREWLITPDLTIGNVESAVGDIGSPAAKSYPFQAPPQAAEALARAGFDIVSLANNHGMDFGPESLLQGISLLQAQNVTPIGAGANETAARTPYIYDTEHLDIAFLAYVNVPVEISGFDTRSWAATADQPGLAWATPDIIAADVAAIKDTVDHVIVVLHSGFEYQFDPSPPQQENSRAAIDAGATVVVGHHAHVLQGIEYYNGGVIVYGLGNFAFEIDGDPRTAILNLWLDKNGVRNIELIPAIIQFGGQPRPAIGQEFADIHNLVYLLTRRLNPGLFDAG